MVPAPTTPLRTMEHKYIPHPTIDDATYAAIADWVEEHGDNWKSALRAAWMRGSAPAPLHRLRNSHGLAWLDAYEHAARTTGDAPKRAPVKSGNIAYPSWEEAHADAQARADHHGRDIALAKSKEFGRTVYVVRGFLPKPENRYGSELTCEVVSPGRCAEDIADAVEARTVICRACNVAPANDGELLCDACTPDPEAERYADARRAEESAARVAVERLNETDRGANR